MTNYTVDILHLGAFTTESGETIENLKLRYEHVGYLGQPLVVACHVPTGNHLTYGTDEHPGWWRETIDGGYMPIYDYQFLTFNVIGSPFDSNFPLSDAHFPKTIILRGIVKAIGSGIKALGFTKIDILIGGSLGDMQVMELSYNHRFEADKAVILAATDKTSSYSRALNEIARETTHIGGKGEPSIARQFGLLTYRSSKSCDACFIPDGVVNYQRHRGNKFKESYDLLCYLMVLDVLDSCHLGRRRDDVDEVFQPLSIKVLMMDPTDDLLYPDDQARAVGKHFKYHRHFSVPDNIGHDDFLLNFSDWAPSLYHFLKVLKSKRK